MLNAILIQKASSDPPRADSFSRGDKKGRWDKALPDPTTISLESPPGHPTSSTILSFLIAVFHPTPVPRGLLTQQWAFSYHEEWGITETEVDQGKGRFGEQGLLLVSGTVVPETARLTSSILTSLHPFFLCPYRRSSSNESSVQRGRQLPILAKPDTTRTNHITSQPWKTADASQFIQIIAVTKHCKLETISYRCLCSCGESPSGRVLGKHLEKLVQVSTLPSIPCVPWALIVLILSHLPIKRDWKLHPTPQRALGE